MTVTRIIAVALALWGAVFAHAAVTVHCIGDSLTLGSGEGNRGGGYRAYLKDALGDRIDFVGSLTTFPGPLTDPEHDGHGGWTTSDLLFGKDGSGTAADWVSMYRPNVVILMIGRNDPSPWIASLQHYRDLADAVFSADPGVRIVWSNVLLGKDQGPGETARCELFDFMLKSVVFEQKSLGRHVTYVDAYRRLKGRDDVFSDNVHLNDFGYSLLARCFQDALRLPEPIGQGR
ncbi:MAG: hypothetical protein JST30_05395 [Armatimonadetes bacterium]|nr:hypothetical protein [Armatimonadota bacterium]